MSGYLDAASAMPLHPAAIEALQASLADGWADPARLYREGRRARLLLDGAREAIAAALGARPAEVSFTSSGTTAVHTAVLGLAAARRRRPGVPVTSAVEHSAVLAALRHLEPTGTPPAHLVAVDRAGRVAAEAFLAGVTAETPLAVLQAANHEVGTLQPVAEVAAGCAERGVPLIVDAAQTIGRLPVPTGWSVLVGSARKWGGPAGIGVLAVQPATRWRSPWPEDEAEGGRFPGAVAVPLAVAAAAALTAQLADAQSRAARDRDLVARIRTALPERIGDVEVLGDPVHRAPHLVAFSCLYVAGEALASALDRAGFSVSSGSSCSSSALTPSHVLEAMGVLTHGNVRVSLHGETAEADVTRLLDVLPGIVADLRRTAGADGL